ncbi:hydroxyphenylacetyl-CoA thioesterase PaaI [Nakamurella lactea]|uniref:hydroxyphenylacetyl-CoA thioesterase PaaI n=1 Tax=Nakamurella lactea TaxID=459515 RepID=UPI0009FF9B9C|nr:hydroxyphenylacetyl-CoA thioesterase PaaI [Nakamurella lactea]
MAEPATDGHPGVAAADRLTVPDSADPAADLAAVGNMLADDAASAGLGMRLTELGLGSATVTMTVRPDMVNGHDIGHGGYIFLVADTAFACACNTHGPVTVAAGADISFVRPAKAGDLLTARAVERARYGRSGIYDVTVSNPAGLVAEFRGRSRTLPR